MKTLRRAAARLGWIGLVCATLGACAMSQEPLRVVSLDAQRVQRAQSQAPALIDRLQQGNRRFMAGEPMRRDAPAMVRATAKGQAPWAAVLSCMDSRSAPELVFDQGVGDLFSVRVAGNVVNDDVLASLEYATQVAGVRLIVVLGHSDCGAVKGACDGVDLGHLPGLLKHMRPALQQTVVAGARNSRNPAFVEAVTHANVEHSAKELLARSPVLARLQREGKLQITGAVLDVGSGRVQFR